MQVVDTDEMAAILNRCKEQVHVQRGLQEVPICTTLNQRHERELSQSKVTPENVKALLDAIHLANGNTDHGHTVEDVEGFVQLFGCKMIALNREGVVGYQHRA